MHQNHKKLVGKMFPFKCFSQIFFADEQENSDYRRYTTLDARWRLLDVLPLILLLLQIIMFFETVNSRVANYQLS